MKELLKSIVRDFIYVCLNYFVNYIPIWWLRKFIYRALGMQIGKGSRICMKCVILSPWNISIGENTMINEYCLLDGRGGLEIGNNCSISMWAIIYTASHLVDSNDFHYYAKKTIVNNCCWIGTRAIIMPGSVINKGAVISVNSCYKGTSIENGIYVGNPAELVRYRKLEQEYIQYNCNFFK